MAPVELHIDSVEISKIGKIELLTVIQCSSPLVCIFIVDEYLNK
jgi:hypothetical protein